MRKWLKVILIIISLSIFCLGIDLVFIFTINRPLFAIKTENNGEITEVYKGLLYDTYNCIEYSVPQIKLKGTKFSCSKSRINLGKALEIVDTTKDIKNFSCQEALEEFYEDSNYTYYYNCLKSKYVIVKYENSYQETVGKALKYGNIKIEDLDNYNIDYIKYEKK